MDVHPNKNGINRYWPIPMSGCQPYGRTVGLGQTMNAIQYRQVAMNRSLHQWRVRPSRVSPRISPEPVGDDEWIATSTENAPWQHVGVNCPFYPSMIYIVSIIYIYIYIYIIILYYIILYYIILYFIILYYIILYYTILYYIALYNIIIYYIIWYYIILHYIIVYNII